MSNFKSNTPLITNASGVSGDDILFGANGDRSSGVPAAFVMQAVADWVQKNSGYGPSCFIAASNAPASVKAKADVVCTGSNDDTLIQEVIDDLPTLPVMSRGGRTIVPGKSGFIQFSEGFFDLANGLVVPTGSVVSIAGVGCSSWCPIDPVNATYEGGTILYSRDVDGEVLTYPKDGSGYPTSGVYLRDIELRVFNGTSNVDGPALDVSGMFTGIVSNVNVLADLSTNNAQKIRTGFSCRCGGNSSRKIISGMNSYGFQVFGMQFDSTHILGLNLDAGNIAGDTYSNCFQITAADDNYYIGIHCFSANYGIHIPAASGVALFIETAHFESIYHPILNQSSNPIFINHIDLDTGVPFDGDLASVVILDKLTMKDYPALLVKSNGVATITTGNSSVAVTHNLIATPKSINLTPQANGTAWITAVGATTFTINVSGAVGSDTSFYWQASV